MSTTCEQSHDMQPSFHLATLNRFPLMQERYLDIELQAQAPCGQLTDVSAILLNIPPFSSLSKLDDCMQLTSEVPLDDIVPSPLPANLNEELYLPCSPQDSGWSNYLELDIDTDPLDEAFTSSKDVDDSGGPTLAALNANAETLDDLDLEHLPLPDENSSVIRGSNVPTPTPDGTSDCLVLPMCASTNQAANPGTLALSSSVDASETSSMAVAPKSALHDLLIRGRSATIASSSPSQHPNWGGVLLHKKRNRRETLSSFTDSFCETFKFREALPAGNDRLSDESSSMQTLDRGSQSSVDSVATCEAHLVPMACVSTKDESEDVDSHDEGFDSEELEDSDNYDVSDADSEVSWHAEGGSLSPTSQKSRKKERYFWQYNLQSKGPKGTRLPLSSESLDPHMLDEVTDPVFSPSCQIKGIKHTGKARRGDGNDLNPNPTKLHQIGQELRKLNKVINDLTPVSELPFNVRPKSRKEKNKLASRACRLKKKAQHEANKLKLCGLEQEHKRLMYVLGEIKKRVDHHTGCNKKEPENFSEHLDRLSKTFLKTKVAGHTAEFVNGIVDKVTSGSLTGGIEQL